MSLSRSFCLQVKAIDRSTPPCPPISANSSYPLVRMKQGGSPSAASRPVRRVLPQRAQRGDTFAVARRLTSEHFVGRRAELEELEQALDAAAGSNPTVVLLGGDSGVGKTRLVGELE